MVLKSYISIPVLAHDGTVKSYKRIPIETETITRPRPTPLDLIAERIKDMSIVD